MHRSKGKPKAPLAQKKDKKNKSKHNSDLKSKLSCELSWRLREIQVAKIKVLGSLHFSNWKKYEHDATCGDTS